jgi:hypothetical protein
VQREVGGNLAEILDTISITIRERVRIKGEIRVLTTQVMYSGRFLSILPIIVILVLYVLNREYMMTYVQPESGICGYIALGVSAVLIVAGYFSMQKLISKSTRTGRLCLFIYHHPFCPRRRDHADGYWFEIQSEMTGRCKPPLAGQAKC